MSDVLSVVITVAVGIFVGVVLLYLEYQTGWFASRVPQSFVQPQKPLAYSDALSMPIENLKYGLQLLYEARPENIVIKSVGSALFGSGKEIRAEITVYKTIQMAGVMRAHIGEYIVWADNLGRIRRTRALKTKFGYPPQRAI